MIDWDLAKLLFDGIQFALIGAIGIYSHIIARQRVTEDELTKYKTHVNRVMNEIVQRLTRVEEAGRHTPTHTDLGDFHEKLNDVHGQLNRVIGELAGVQAQLRTINEHLLDRH